MRNLLFNLLLITVLPACERDSLELTAPQNPFVGTSWMAEDWISAVIYGDGTTTTVEFLTDTECQVIDFKPGRGLGTTTVQQGTYTYNGNEVTWQEGDRFRTGTKSGSVIIVELSEGRQYVYHKQ